MKFLPLFLFIFLFSFSLVAAQPPFEAVILNQGIDIAFPQIDVLKLNSDFEFHFHVVNNSNGVMLDNTTVNCGFHLFNSSGNHIFEDDSVNMDINGDDFTILIDKNNFSRVDDYAYLFGCHNETQNIGGQISRGLEVTQDGEVSIVFPQQFSIIALGIILIMFGILNQRYKLLKHMGSIIVMVMGVITLFPGYNNISHTSLFGLAFGSSLIAIGAWFFIEDSFSREEQEQNFHQNQGKSETNEGDEKN